MSTTTVFLPRAILPLLIASAAASVFVYFVRSYLCPPAENDPEDRRRALRETVLCFLAAVLACFTWHVVGPFSDRWHHLLGSGGGGGGQDMLAATVGAAVPVNATIPTW